MSTHYCLAAIAYSRSAGCGIAPPVYSRSVSILSMSICSDGGEDIMPYLIEALALQTAARDSKVDKCHSRA